MRITTEKLGESGILLALDGELDAYTGAQLREELDKVIEADNRWLVLDMSKLQYIDSMGLGILMSAVKRTHERQGGVAVVCAEGLVRHMFERSGTTDLLNVVGTLEEAKSRLKGLRTDTGEGE